MWWDLGMFGKIAFVIFTCACFGASAFGAEAALPEAKEFVELVLSSAKSATPLSEEQHQGIASAVFRLREVVSESKNTTLLADEAFLTALGKLIAVSNRLEEKNFEDLHACAALSRLLLTVFWSKDLSQDGAKRVLDAEIGILKRFFEEDELLKKAGAAPGIVMLDNVVYINTPGPTAEELKKRDSTARYNYVERAEWEIFERICDASRKFEPGTTEQRMNYLKAAGLTAGQIEKCLMLGRNMDPEAFERRAARL